MILINANNLIKRFNRNETINSSVMHIIHHRRACKSESLN